MFKRSLLLVLSIVLLVFTSAFATQMALTRDLPSSYDPGLTIQEAFQTSKVPLLIEFYSDTCGTCKKVTPMLHELKQSAYKDRLTLVMLDVEDPDTAMVAQLFGVEELPALYVFDHHHMKKLQIPMKAMQNEGLLKASIDEALSRLLLKASGDAEAVALEETADR